MDYLTLKWMHILSSTALMGTGLGIAFFMWMAHLSCDARNIAATARMVVIADAVFTAPAVVVQFVTGLWLAKLLHLPLGTFWIKTALILFVVTGACWLPVVWLQIKARDLARQAVIAGAPLSPVYRRVMRWWFWLGWPAFISVIAIFWLMVHKPLGV
ncbi:MAG: DUF2269 domain-containing protein [Lysobacterales bacterium]|jgi:uncharacterized membrane protein